jgi:hypothetical protein
MFNKKGALDCLNLFRQSKTPGKKGAFSVGISAEKTPGKLPPVFAADYSALLRCASLTYFFK